MVVKKKKAVFDFSRNMPILVIICDVCYCNSKLGGLLILYFNAPFSLIYINPMQMNTVLEQYERLQKSDEQSCYNFLCNVETTLKRMNNKK